MSFTSHSDNFWDQRYDTEEFIYGRLPNPFVASMSHLYQPGMQALVPGDGEGPQASAGVQIDSLRTHDPG